MLPPPIFLNHFFATLDHATFAAIRNAEWLKSVFAPYEERTTIRRDSTYTGVYFYGRNTYFEFFEEGSEPGKSRGASGIAFGVETPGAARQLSALLPDQVEITRRVGNDDPVWFHSASPAGTRREDFFRTWVMEYHAEFLKRWYPELPPVLAPNANPLRRRTVLDRYVAKIGLLPRRDEFLLKDVTAIELALDAAGRDKFEKLLTAFGWQTTGSVVTGPEVRIALLPTTATAAPAGKPPGIRSIAFSLQRAVAGEIRQRFGNSELVVSPRGQALWTLY